jgi:hypothetical protein
MFIDTIYVLKARSGSKTKLHILVPLIKPARYMCCHIYKIVFKTAMPVSKRPK